MGLRAVIVEKNADDRAMLSRILRDLGHVAAEYSGPEFCQAYVLGEDACQQNDCCHDLQIFNNVFDGSVTGLELVEWQRLHGCRLSGANSAVVADDWPPGEVKSADLLGVRSFTKPFMVKDLVDWLYRVKKVKRKL